MYSLNPLSSQEDDKWSVNLQVEGCENKIIFKIDIGAKCNVISLHDYEAIQHGGKILPTNKILQSYSKHRIQPIGDVRLTVGTEKHSTTVPFLIVDNEQDSVISGATAEKLSLIQRVNTIQSELPPELHDFPDIERNTGTLPGKYKIKIENGAKGVIHPARRQPVALLPKIKTKLDEMVADRFLQKVDTPTE
jgi:hypothetical protein